MKHKPPKFGELRFSCPHCGALSHQHWHSLHAKRLKKDELPDRYDLDKLKQRKTELESVAEENTTEINHIFEELFRAANNEVFLSTRRADPYSYNVYNVEISQCDSCMAAGIWLNDRLIFPPSSPAGMASEDMPQPVKALFEEASAVFTTSPRASAALLRLALQHLLIELGEKGKNINSDINALIDKGLDHETARIMHSLRIVGNESVHPGEISFDDEPYMAEALFDLLNQIVDQLITRPRRRQELWERLPEEKRKQVEDRTGSEN